MILLLHQDLANLLSHRIFSKRFTLWNAIAVITNGFIFVVEIVAEHVSRVFRCADRLRTSHRHFAEVIDLPRQDQCMIEFLLGVNFELSGDVHVFGALEHLGIDDVSDDGLIFAGQVFVQQLRETVRGDFVGFLFRHLIPPLD